MGARRGRLWQGDALSTAPHLTRPLASVSLSFLSISTFFMVMLVTSDTFLQGSLLAFGIWLAGYAKALGGEVSPPCVHDRCSLRETGRLIPSAACSWTRLCLRPPCVVQVYKGLWNEVQDVAVKMVVGQSAEQQARFLREVGLVWFTKTDITSGSDPAHKLHQAPG